MVTHKLTEDILSRFDEIVVLANQSVIEHGDYRTLMDLKGYFYSLVTIGSSNI